MPYRIIKTMDGKRGGFLLLVGVVQFFLGLSYVLVHTPGRAESFSWMPEWFTLPTFGWLLIIGAVVAVSISLFSKVLPGRFESLALVSLAAPLSLAAVIHAGAWIIGNNANSWVSAVIYGAFTCLVMYVANWDNPRPTVRTPEKVHEDEEQ